MQKFRKIGIFLLPGQKASEEIYDMKTYYKSFENKQNYLNDFPLLTLFHGVYKDYKTLEKNIKKNMDLMKELKIIHMNLIDNSFLKMMWKNSSTLVYLIDKSETNSNIPVKASK